jgi:hypothetical protein
MEASGQHDDLLVEKRYPQKSSPDGLKNAQSRNHLAFIRKLVSSDRAVKLTVRTLHTLSAFPLNPTSVPRCVYRFWEAERDTDRRE